MSRKKTRAAPREKAPTTPTPQRRRALGRFRVLSVLFLSGGLVGLAFLGRDWWAQQRLRDRGIAVPAQVVGYDKTISARGETTYQVTVQFQPQTSWAAAPEGLRRQFPLTEEAYRGSRSGRPLTVRYLPEDPEGAMLDGQDADTRDKLAMSLVALALGGALAFLAFRKPKT